MNRRLSLALPSKGRLREPSWSLLEASGVSPQEPGERVLQSHCRNADIDLLFVRARTCPSTSRRLVDCGITGLDLISERECDVEVLLRLGYGAARCRPRSRWKMTPSIGDLAGRRIATSHPRIARRALADLGIDAELVQVTGSVEISPRLGLADAIIDLVSTGSTLRPNGLRSIGTLFESSGVGGKGRFEWITRLVARSRWCSGRSSTLVDATFCNVAKSRLRSDGAFARRVAHGHGSGDTSIVAGATQFAVPAAEIWSLLPRLEAAGAEFDSHAARRTDGAVSKPVVTEKPVTIEEIVNDVRARGDAALVAWSKKFDARPPRSPASRRPTATSRRRPYWLRRRTYATWHAAPRPADLTLEVSPGVTLERRWTPIRSIGTLCSHRLVSSLIMSGVPAQVAGVEESCLHAAQRFGRGRGRGRAPRHRRGLGNRRAQPSRRWLRHRIDRAVDKIFGPGGGR